MRIDRQLSSVPQEVRRGYALVLTLMLLVIVVTSAASLCRVSLRAALRARDAQDDLRQRWGALSARAALLPKAEQILSRQQAPAPSATLHVRLNGSTWRFVIGDEQAKANINLLYRRRGIAQTEIAARALISQTQQPVRVELRPMAGRAADDADEPPPAFLAIDQALAARPAELLARRGQQLAPADVLTCFGDGSLNVRRAPRGALDQMCRPHLSSAQITRLLAWRTEPSDVQDDLWDELDRMGLSPAAQDALEDLVTDRSTCHSLWIVAPRSRGERFTFAVAGAEFSDTPDVITYEW